MTIQELNSETKELLKNNVENLRANIENAKKKQKVNKDITLLAATKTVPAEVINYVCHQLGVTDIGENRVQELLDKYDSLDLDGIKLHFIGKLQSNKVKYIIDKVDMIHSLDSIKLASEIDKRAKAIGKIMDVLVEDINRQDAEFVTGRLSNNSVVHFKGGEELIGKIVNVKLTEAKGFYYLGEIVE